MALFFIIVQAKVTKACWNDEKNIQFDNLVANNLRDGECHVGV